MIFSELYGAYYNTVAKMIECAQEGELTKAMMYDITERYAFNESMMTIIPSIENETWQIITKKLTTPVKKKPRMPLTTLQKRWLKAVSMDARVKLFDVDFSFLADVEPLFLPDDIVLFDKYLDGDDYEDEAYIERFRTILYAMKNRKAVEIVMKNKCGELIRRCLLPKKLEYSKKDDKFRLIGHGVRSYEMINLQKIISCTLKSEGLKAGRHVRKREGQSVTFELYDERKALERVLLHFAHFKKEAVQTGDYTYRITVWYDRFDETEIVIRILSFGPLIKVVEPESFVSLIKERLIKQKICGI